VALGRRLKVASGERRATGHRLVEHHADEVDVRPHLAGFAGHGLGRDVLDAGPAGFFGFARRVFEQEHMPHADAPEHRTLETEGVLDEKDVARLQVEVQQIGAVQGFERLQDLTHQALGERGLERAGRLDSPGHRLPVEQGFDDEEITIGVHARIEGRDEVGVPSSLARCASLSRCCAFGVPGSTSGLKILIATGRPSTTSSPR
jgi:hypothetical protein